MSRRRRALAALLGSTLLFLPGAPAGTAAAAVPAHAQLVSTDPEDGATVDTVTEVSMTFSEDINEKFVEVRVAGPGGDEADGAPTVAGGVLTQEVVADLPAGEHTVTYRVVSVDGHPVSGQFRFTTTQQPSAPATSTSPSSPTASTAPAPSTTTTPPAVSSPGASPSASPVATSSEGTPGWLVPVLVALVLLVLLAGGIMLARPRRSPGEDDAG